MKRHPALAMLQIWAGCLIAFYVLPFVLVGRELTGRGFAMLALFIGAFCLGAAINSRPRFVTQDRSAALASLNTALADKVLTGLILVLLAAVGVELLQGNYLDLQSAWEIRADRATSLTTGAASESSALFQVVFLLFPVAYVVIVREIILEPRVRMARLAAFGGLPILMVALMFGGRGPILFAMFLAFVAYRMRKRFFGQQSPQRRKVDPTTLLYGLIFLVVGLAAMNYFVVVFVTRAEGVGGVEAMFDLVATIWGATFAGPVADVMTSVFGAGNTYLAFAFSWYLVQGLVMSNTLFTDFQGPFHSGVYGFELVTALMRRIDGTFVADRFASIEPLNIIGFFPSAWGSFWVDFGYAGVGLAALWGYLASLVFRRCREGVDARWLMWAPLVALGIFFSLINSPLGFGNGLMTHFWMLVTFWIMRARPQPARPTRDQIPQAAE